MIEKQDNTIGTNPQPRALLLSTADVTRIPTKCSSKDKSETCAEEGILDKSTREWRPQNVDQKQVVSQLSQEEIDERFPKRTSIKDQGNIRRRTSTSALPTNKVVAEVDIGWSNCFGSTWNSSPRSRDRIGKAETVQFEDELDRVPEGIQWSWRNDSGTVASGRNSQARNGSSQVASGRISSDRQSTMKRDSPFPIVEKQYPRGRVGKRRLSV